MYARHVPLLNEAIARSPVAWERAALLTLVSIRRPFWRVPIMLNDVRRNGSNSRELFGWKRQSYQFIVANARRMQRAAKTCEGDLMAMTLLYMQIPGFGMVKSQFLCQMTYGEGACMDTVNCHLYGIPNKALTNSKKAHPRTVARKIRQYTELWRSHGDSRHHWDTWCETIAERVPERLPTAFTVSKLHCDAVL